MDNKKKFYLMSLMFALIALLALSSLFYLISAKEQHSSYLEKEGAGVDVGSEEFNNKVNLAVDSKNLNICESFEEEALRITCLVQATPLTWLVYRDESVCDSISQNPISEPVKFAGNPLYDYHGACLTFLSLGAGEDFCHKAPSSLSEDSCRSIFQRNLK